MSEVSKFISMEGNEGANSNISANKIETEMDNSAFRVCKADGSNLPAKPTLWSKLKGILTYEVKVELTPYQQKIEDEINEFLHQEITWQKFKDFLFQDVVITTGKNKVK